MKLEPVFLVAPLPAPKSMPTRRAWLLAGGAFVAGTVTGSACQSWFGAQAAAPPPPVDPTHAWLRTLCDDGTPIEELLTNRAFLLLNLPKWSDDPLLWHGIDRLVGAARERSELPDRKRLALELAGFLENTELPADASLRWDLEALRAIGRGR